MSFSKWRVYFVHQALLYQTRYIHGDGWVTCDGAAHVQFKMKLGIARKVEHLVWTLTKIFIQDIGLFEGQVLQEFASQQIVAAIWNIVKDAGQDPAHGCSNNRIFLGNTRLEQANTADMGLIIIWVNQFNRQAIIGHNLFFTVNQYLLLGQKSLQESIG